ncbi:MAG: amino acid racemase [Paracoccus sp. (in: a-proteobacteria)]|nr:amino acid racemase [Paracoccus sp. (in: a-proteobacteria)]
MLNIKARALEGGGADLLILATDPMHKVAEPMMTGVAIPLLHIADATAARIRAAGLRRPGLMATAFTMEQSFYTSRLTAAGLQPTIPETPDRGKIHCIIFQELCRDIVTDCSRAAYVTMADRLAARGADSLILGCIEVGMLLNRGNVAVPVFDTALIHRETALA